MTAVEFDRRTSTAILRAYLAWQRTQPQLTIDGWADMLDGLDQAQPGALGLIESVDGGLDIQTGKRVQVPPTGLYAESAPVVSPSGRTHFEIANGPDAVACRLARPGQKGA